MNNEEAINELKEVYNRLEFKYEATTANAFDSAISALEKQIPKKPIFNFRNGCWYCSMCRRAVSSVQKYCEHCGQAIDWSEE